MTSSLSLPSMNPTQMFRSQGHMARHFGVPTPLEYAETPMPFTGDQPQPQMPDRGAKFWTGW